MNRIKLQHKRARKEAKRNLRRKAIRKELDRLNSLGTERKHLSLQRAERTKQIKQSLASLDFTIKKWNDKIDEKLLSKIKARKFLLKLAMKSKDDYHIQEAIANLVPLSQEVFQLVQKLDAPIVKV